MIAGTLSAALFAVAMVPSLSAQIAQGPCSKNSEAQPLYARGLEFLDKSDTRRGGTLENAREAIKLFDQVVKLDPQCAAAYASLSDAWSRFSFSVPGSLPNAETYPHEKAAALKAVQLDDSMTIAHFLLAQIYFDEAYDWASAETEFKRVIQLTPDRASAHVRYGIFLGAMGKFDEAIAEVHTAQELDNSSPAPQQAMLQILYWQRRDEEAAKQGLEALMKDEQSILTHYLMSFVCERLGKFNEAIEHAKLATAKGDAGSLSMLGYAYAVSGNKAEAERVLEQLNHHGGAKNVPYRIAAIHLALGDKNRALDLIERDYAQRSNWINRLKVDPVMDPLRNEPRFKELMRKLKFPD